LEYEKPRKRQARPSIRARRRCGYRHDHPQRSAMEGAAPAAPLLPRVPRVAVGALELGDLAKGSWRHLTAEEVASLAPSRTR
jgi:hypothetical protein